MITPFGRFLKFIKVINVYENEVSCNLWHPITWLIILIFLISAPFISMFVNETLIDIVKEFLESIFNVSDKHEIL
jgi:hypothetical protein